MQLSKLISISNLNLAWRRITTGRNLQYKRFFRHLLVNYELGVEDNLQLLRKKLKGPWEPNPPYRMFIPKPSGLQRPITLLDIEDQIILQAIANIYGYLLRERRKKVENAVVFSNCLNRNKSSIFFLEDWRHTYRLFKNKIESYYDQGYRWIAHFDLAAYYDTISHELLLQLISPRGGSQELVHFISRSLKCWTSISTKDSRSHGIPQGPLASDFLAECFLLPIDESLMRQNLPYTRYVDDIRLFAKTELEVHKAVVKLEMACRDIGLLPQGSKFAIKRAMSTIDALGMLPSLGQPDGERKNTSELDESSAEQLFYDSIAGRPYRVIDKTRFRYVLYRAPKSKKLLNWVNILLPRHPEHIDAFVAYLELYTKSKPIENTVLKLLQQGMPYEYVRGELWKLIARLGSTESLSDLFDLAKADFKSNKMSIPLAWGASVFLLECEKRGVGKYPFRINSLSPLVQSLLIKSLTPRLLSDKSLMANLISSPNCLPSLAMINPIIEHGKRISDFGVNAKNIHEVTQNCYRSIGLIKRRTFSQIDQFAELLSRRYGIHALPVWRAILRDNYGHTLQLIRNAEAAYDIDKSQWLQMQNSVNDAIYRGLHDNILSGNKFAIKTINKKGELVSFGVMLDAQKPFSKLYPGIADAFRAGNDRRNKLPYSHPFDTKSGKKNTYLKKREQDKLKIMFGKSYALIQTLVK
jgi:hypothetical protein